MAGSGVHCRQSSVYGWTDFRRELGDHYAEALWKAYPDISGGAHIAMFWWDVAASILKKKGTALRRFGLVSSNSITQEFSNRVVAAHLSGSNPISLSMAIPDHPWTKATKGAAAVRIAMTVGELTGSKGVLSVRPTTLRVI